MKDLLKDALRRIRDHRTRSVIVCAAVVLTAVLYITVLSITSDIFSAFELSLMLAGGSDYHGVISETESLRVPRVEILNEIRKNPLVAEANSLTPLGIYATDEDSLVSSNLEMFDVDSEAALPHLFFTLTEGRFPENGDEVLLLKSLYPEQGVGDEITLWLLRERDNGLDSYPRAFTVCGFYETATKRTNFSAITHGAAEADARTNYFIYLRNRANPEGKLERIAEEAERFIGQEEVFRYDVNNAYLSASLGGNINAASVALVVLAVATVFFAAFLLIYSVYAVALSQDMRMQGLLWVLGMTQKQRREAVRAEAWLLWLFAAPVGMLAGYGIGWRLLTPIFMSMSGEDLPYRFRLWVPLVSAALTLLTLLFSAARPLKKIAKLSPVDASRGAGPNEKRSARWVRRRSTADTRLLGMTSVTRDFRRHFIPALSVALSALLVSLVSAACAVMRESTLSYLSATDYQLSIRERDALSGYELSVGMESGVGFSAEFLEQIASLDGVESTWPVRVVTFTVPATAAQREIASSQLGWYREHGMDDRDIVSWQPALYGAANGTLTIDAVGIPRKALSSIPLNNPEYATAADVPDGDVLITPGMYRTEIEPYFHGGERITCGMSGRTYTVVASDGWSWDATSRVISELQFYESGAQLVLLPLDRFEEEFPDSIVFGILVDEANGLSGTLKQRLEELSAEFGADAVTGPVSQNAGYVVRLESRFDTLEDLRERLNALTVVGYSLAVLLFLIGALGIVNAALASAASRRRETALLEAVGMTGRQLGIMNFCENAFSVFVSAAVLAVSLPLLTRLLSAGFDTDVKVDPVPAAVLIGAQLVLSFAVSAATFRRMRMRPLGERLRQGEE